jgi:16S rRNA (uracil1498-N3)-methyltransferase
VELFDGLGSAYRSRVRITEPRVELEIIEKLATQAESPLKLMLGQSLIKGDKMSWVIQKGTELGITDLYPLTSRFSETNLKQQAVRQWDQRWKKIAVSAAAQCRRANTPVIHPIMDLGELCGEFSGRTHSPSFLPGMDACSAPTLKLVVSEKGGLPARSLSGFVSPASVLLVVGPEGGWADEEITLFKDSGFMEFFLGNRILRSETAALVAVSLAQFLWGDIGTS